MEAKLIEREKHSRDDGFLVELFSERYNDFEASHSYLVTMEPGSSRAGHYHRKKTEVIFPAAGKVAITLTDVENKESRSVELDCESGRFAGVIVPPGVWHLVRNETDKPARIVVFSDSAELEDTHRVDG
ncbi:MAG: cupin domain-containing protein [Candidatus Micrarchaeota archaeon]